MKLSIEELESLNHISTIEIKNDISITQKKIKQFENELKTLYNNRLQNRTKIYLTEVKIGKRRDFIDKLNQVIEYRNNSQS